MIKAAKRAISFMGAESLMNSRPLTYQSVNPEDDMPLTPNHFLQGHNYWYVEEVICNPKKHRRRTQELTRHFWHRWIPKWVIKRKSFKVDQLRM